METRRYAARRVTAARSVTAGVFWRRVLLGGILALALAVRFREPLASPVIGAEDPYLHMARTWDLLDGHLSTDYPPGFVILLAPFALLGPEVFAFVARFLPPFLGVVQVLGVYLLCRENLRTPAALVAATCVALMPENILRTNLLFPTALDLALLPFFLLHLLRATRGERISLAWCAGIALVLGVAHPWVLVYMMPPAIAAAFLMMRRKVDRVVGIVALGLLALAALLFAFLPGTWNPAPAFLQNAGPRALELLRDPRTILPLPMYVDSFPGMVSWSVIALAGVGVLTALVRRTPIGIVALVYALSIVPFVFVDWFDVWFIPHRSVAYLSLGMAILAALPVELMGALPEWNMGDVAAAAVIGTYLVLAMTGPAFDVTPWYRLYDEDDYAAWDAIDDRDPSLVISGSWQGAVGYRAITGNDALYNPTFFQSGEAQAHDTRQHPDAIVLLDAFAREDGVRPPSGWREVGRWGDTRAYAAP
ncbi:MAG TPA: glycosyltransferase family 39 protein [Candidatus Thermoplasmatota archaeon]|nr:glycosyltransferase family 39 protein [Candidatus Thermoplasmatota archaeon]